MTYDATVKLCYINNTEATISSKYFPEIVDKHSITIEAPAQDMNVYQHFELFKAFLRAMDFAEYSIMDGACRLAFNDSNDGEQMKKLMNEYELQDKQYHTDDEYYALKEEVRELKEKLARVLPEQYKEWNGLVPGSDQACRAGCKCPVMDNAEMPNDRKWVNGDCPLHGKEK
jgi:hypothetical protein